MWQNYPLQTIAHSMRRPSFWQNNWVPYSFFGIVSALAAREVVKRVVDGSMLNAFTLAESTVRNAYHDHVLQPVTALIKEVFYTIQKREEIVNEQDLESSRDALNRMLVDFSKSNKGLQLFRQLKSTISHMSERASSAVSRNETADLSISNLDVPRVTNFSAEEAMDALMKSYEAELPNPIRGVIFGNLSTSILIQVNTIHDVCT